MSNYHVDRVFDPKGKFVGWAVIGLQGQHRAGPYPFHSMAEDEAYRLSLRDEQARRQREEYALDE
ncbi:hypothetical protein OL229_12450 [Neisseriaceae bacterium JH1-16]|nr:hypothetical protein [Neisseriaceae bacterium JH1-16]